jgi:hypothetical protein
MYSLLQHLVVRKFGPAQFVKVLHFIYRDFVFNPLNEFEFVLQLFVGLATRCLCHIFLPVVKITTSIIALRDSANDVQCGMNDWIESINGRFDGQTTNDWSYLYSPTSKVSAKLAS